MFTHLVPSIICIDTQSRVCVSVHICMGVGRRMKENQRYKPSFTGSQNPSRLLKGSQLITNKCFGSISIYFKRYSSERQVLLGWSQNAIKQMQVCVPETQWDQTNQNIGIWSRERVIAGHCKSPKLLEGFWEGIFKGKVRMRGCMLSRFSHVWLFETPWL